MLGLALMAMQLADKRMEERGVFSRISFGLSYSGEGNGPVSKWSALTSPSVYPASFEYYQIMYRLSQGKPA